MSIELENVSRMTLGRGRLLWNPDSKPPGRFDQSCAIEEEKSFYDSVRGKMGVLGQFMRSLSSDSDRGVIFPDGSIHGDTHVTCPISA